MIWNKPPKEPGNYPGMVGDVRMQLRTFGTWSGTISGIGAGALTASPEYAYLAKYLAAGSATVWAALLILFLISNRQEIRRGTTKLGSWYFIVPCLALAILAIAGAAYGFGLRSATFAAKNSTAPANEQAVVIDPTKYHELLKNLRVDGILHPDNPLLLSGEAAEHIARARIVVEVKGRAYGRWIERFRVELPTITDKLKGDRFYIPLVSHVDKPNPQNPQEFFWGDSKENYPVYFGPMLVRILLTNAKGEDQAPFYFMLFRGADVTLQDGAATSPSPIYILQSGDMDWMKQWDER